MKKFVLCTLVIVLAAGCGTLPKCGILPKEDRIMVREFNAINRLSAHDINFIKALGLDPDHLTLEDKALVMKEGQAFSAVLMMGR